MNTIFEASSPNPTKLRTLCEETILGNKASVSENEIHRQSSKEEGVNDRDGIVDGLIIITKTLGPSYTMPKRRIHTHTHT
mgnify:FL=1